jgi:hypothetical protein
VQLLGNQGFLNDLFMVEVIEVGIINVGVDQNNNLLFLIWNFLTLKKW